MRQCDNAKVGLIFAILECAAAENYLCGRKDGMASSTTRKFKSLQAALAESLD